MVVCLAAAVDDHLRHGDLVGLALACLDDLLGGLVVDGVEDQLCQREQHPQPVGDLSKFNKENVINRPSLNLLSDRR